MDKQRGFTLVELMVVIALIAILATFAMISFGKNSSVNAVGNWTAANRDAIATASRRAIASRQPFMVVFTPTTVRWCQVVNPGTAAANWADASNACPGAPVAGFEYGPLVDAGAHGAYSAQYTYGADAVLANGTYTAPTRTAMGAAVLYAGRNGVITSSAKIAATSSGLPDSALANQIGFTLYTKSKFNDTTNTYGKRLVVYGLTGKARIFDDR